MAEFTGLLGDALGWMNSPLRTQQMQGLGGLISSGLSSISDTDKKYQELYAKAFGDPKNRWGGNFKSLVDCPHFERNV